MGPEHIRNSLQKISGRNTIIVCIGNELKGDDAAGPVLYNELKGKIGCDIINTGTVPENYIQTIVNKNPDNIIVIDAVDYDGTAGEIRLFKDDEVPEIALSTHVLSPRMFFDMIKSQCQANITLIGIQPQHLDLNHKLSESVSKSLDEIEKILTELIT